MSRSALAGCPVLTVTSLFGCRVTRAMSPELTVRRKVLRLSGIVFAWCFLEAAYAAPPWRPWERPADFSLPKSGTVVATFRPVIADGVQTATNPATDESGGKWHYLVGPHGRLREHDLRANPVPRRVPAPARRAGQHPGLGRRRFPLREVAHRIVSSSSTWRTGRRAHRRRTFPGGSRLTRTSPAGKAPRSLHGWAARCGRRSSRT